jgi:Tfp pilus assembly protein PilF
VPWSPDPARWRATVALGRGHRSEARRLLDKALARDSTDWSLWMEMAAASDGRARVSAARRAIRLNPRGGEVFYAALQSGLFEKRGPEARAK